MLCTQINCVTAAAATASTTASATAAGTATTTPMDCSQIDILTSSNLERMLHLLCTKAEVADVGTEVRRCFEALNKQGHFEVSPAVLSILQAEMQVCGQKLGHSRLTRSPWLVWRPPWKSTD